MCFAKDHDLIQALASQRADQTFSDTILPWRSRRDWPVADAHRRDAIGEDPPIGAVIIAHQVAWRRPGECLGDLSGEPRCRRVAGDFEPQELPPTMA